jgi:hypothetical protein
MMPLFVVQDDIDEKTRRAALDGAGKLAVFLHDACLGLDVLIETSRAKLAAIIKRNGWSARFG